MCTYECNYFAGNMKHLNLLFSGPSISACEFCKLEEIVQAFEFNDVDYLLDRSQTKYQIVLTKTDTVFPIDVARRAMQVEDVNIEQV